MDFTSFDNGVNTNRFLCKNIVLSNSFDILCTSLVKSQNFCNFICHTFDHSVFLLNIVILLFLNFVGSNADYLDKTSIFDMKK